MGTNRASPREARPATGWLILGLAAGTAGAAVLVHLWGEDTLLGALPYVFPALGAAWLGSRSIIALELAAVGALLAGETTDRGLGLALGEAAGTLAVIAALALMAAFARGRAREAVARLTDIAQRDPLTALLNRRGFEDALEAELERARRTGAGLSLIVADLDSFKQLNDSHGHAAGDQALRQVADAMRSSRRSWDAIARVGGEEFALLAPHTDEHGAYILAERVRTAIERSLARGPEGPLTASFGIASHPGHGQSAEALLQAADQALYAAKRLGRNRSVVASAEVSGVPPSRERSDRAETPVELGSLLTLAEALDVRDSGSTTHCHRVGRYAELIARELGLSPTSVERIRIAGVLHDVGRVGVPDELISRDGPLSREEWRWVRLHPEIGARMLETTDSEDIGAWVLAHHERPDGTGYPAGARAQELPLEGAILGVADAYEAMTAGRPYRPAIDPQVATDELRRGAGRQWDERVVDALLRVV